MKEDLCFFLPPAESIPFYAELAGISYCDGTYFQQRRDSPICVLEYVVEGTGTLIINGQKLSASAGDVYILPLGSNHTYYSDEKHPWTKIFLNAGGELAPFLLRAYHLDTQFVFPQCPVEPLFRELLNIANGPALQEARNARMALQLHKIVQGIYQHAKRYPQGDEAALLKNLIDNRSSHVFTITELAEKIQRSEDYVIKLFKKRYGVTPHVYSTDRKMEAARKQLADTRRPVGEIAQSLGYDNPEYFSNLFKKHQGVSPRTYRNKAGSGKSARARY